MSGQHSIHHDKAIAFLSTITARDGHANIALRTPNCEHTILPASMGFTRNLSNEKWLENLDYMNSVLSKFMLKPTELMETDRQIAISANGFLEVRPELRDAELEKWSSDSDLVFVLHFNENGKIDKILEMLDSDAAKSFWQAMTRAGENLKKLHDNE